MRIFLSRPVMAVASSAATSSAASNSVTTTTQSAPQQQQQNMMSPAQMPTQQPMQNVAPTIQQVIPQQSQQQPGLMQIPPCISSASFGPITTTTTTTHAVRSSYKPIAPAPPQQHQGGQPPNLIAMAPHPHQVNMTSNEKTDQQHPQILTIPVGSAVYPMNMTGTHNIRSATPMNNFQTMNGDLGQHQQGQLNIHMPMSSSQPTTCFITNPAVTSASRMSAPLGGGLITVGPAAPLSAMASMTQAVPPSSSPITISTQGPRMAMPPLQPVTVTVSASPAPQFPLPSPARQPSAPLLSVAEKVEEPKQSPRTPAEPIPVPSAPTPTSSVEDVSAKKEVSQLNGTGTGQQNENHITNHSPALREKKEPNLPQAVVRPQILTHVLGDFVIQESSEPFPVGRFHPNEALTRCNGHRNHENYNFKLDGEPPSKSITIIICRIFCELFCR